MLPEGAERSGIGGLPIDEDTPSGAGSPPEYVPLAPELAVLLQRVLAPLLAENARLVDRLSAQAEEIGRLRERARQLEGRQEAQSQSGVNRARALRTLLDALHEP